jgi:broad specificity phosphatase PhoE
LNDLGRRQADALTNKLSAEPLSEVVSSDLNRAYVMASTIANGHAIPLVSEPRLREVNFGAWEGLTHGEIKNRDAKTLADWEAGSLQASPPGGESLGQISARVAAVYRGLTERGPDQTILIVAHGGPLQVLLCLALGISPVRYWQFHLSPASLSRLSVYPAGAILNSLNETGHLEVG